MRWGYGESWEALRVKQNMRSREGTPGALGCWAASARSRRRPPVVGAKAGSRRSCRFWDVRPDSTGTRAAGLEVRAGRQSWGLCRDSASVPRPLPHDSAEIVSVVLKPQDCKLSLSASKLLFQRFSFGNADGAREPAFHRQMVTLEASGHTLRSTSSGVRSSLGVWPAVSGCLLCSQLCAGSCRDPEITVHRGPFHAK